MGPTNTAPFIIGNLSARPSSGLGFGGLIDEVEAYNRALSGEEIQAIYNAGSKGKCKPEGTPPQITSTPITTATEGQPYVYDVEATDPDAGDVLTFLLDVAPAGMTIDAATGLVHWTPDATQIGGHLITVRVEDTGGLFDTQSFTISFPQLVQISGLYNTGVDDAGNLLPLGSADSHYMIGTATSFVANPIPGVWVANNLTSQWVSPSVNQDQFNLPGGDPEGYYTYSLRFDLSGLDASTASISGKLAADDQVQVSLNGVPTDIFVTRYSFSNFSINSGNPKSDGPACRAERYRI
jgi:hypothetical protein